MVENFKPVEEPKVIEKYKLFEGFKVIETNEPVVNEVVDLKPIENKEMEITLRHDDFLETSSEVKFTSMDLKSFPIKYRNFSKDLEPLKTNFLGITDVDFGNVRLEGVSIKILDFLDFIMSKTDRLQTTYLYINDEIDKYMTDKNITNFINKYSIEIIKGEAKDFIPNLKERFFDERKSGDALQNFA